MLSDSSSSHHILSPVRVGKHLLLLRGLVSSLRRKSVGREHVLMFLAARSSSKL